jgi:hypothetical protein
LVSTNYPEISTGQTEHANMPSEFENVVHWLAEHGANLTPQQVSRLRLALDDALVQAEYNAKVTLEAVARADEIAREAGAASIDDLLRRASHLKVTAKS